MGFSPVPPGLLWSTRASTPQPVNTVSTQPWETTLRKRNSTLLLEFSLEKIAKAPHETRTPRVAVKEYVK